MSGFCSDPRCVLGTTLAEIQWMEGRSVTVYAFCEECNPGHLDEEEWAAEHGEDTQP